MATKTMAQPASAEPQLAVQALNDLRSAKCFCGGRKREQQSFCTRCYHKLPANIRQGLYASFRDGYVRFYEAAKEFLEQLKSGARPAVTS